MKYVLKQTEQYLDDLRNLPPKLQSRVKIVHERLEIDPQHPGLKSHLFQSTKSKIYRSYVADNYRVVWQYDFKSIVLLNIGTHNYIDTLFSPLKTTFQSYKIDTTTVNEQPNQSFENSSDVHRVQLSRQQRPLPIFRNVKSEHLRAITVPKDKIEDVKRITDIDDLLKFDLPLSAYQFLVNIYTNPDWDENYLNLSSVMYRANSDEIDSYCRGEIKKLMLDLSPEQEELTRFEAPGAVLIKGVAGSGKTTIGVYQIINRLKKHQLFTTQPILFLTYNETLASVISKMFMELLPQSEHGNFQKSVIVKTLREFCISQLLGDNNTYDTKRAETILSQVISEYIPRDSKFEYMKKGDFIPTEISQVIKGRDIKTWETYKSIARVGMMKQLVYSARELVWKIYEEYQQKLRRESVLDEIDLIINTLQKVEGDNGFIPFRHIVLDEAQDFPPIALKLAATLVGRTQRQSLTLLADPLQSIYYKGIPWKDGGIKIHSSRVRTLSKNYRNSRQILEAAWAVAKNNPKRDLDDIIEPSKASREHLKPRLVYVNQQSEKDIKLMKEYVLRFVETNKYRLGDTAVMCRRIDDTHRIKNSLESLGIPVCHFREDNFDIFQNDVKVITFHSAKGLEFPNVILMNVEEGVIPRKLDYLLDTEEIQSELSRERQLFYVAMTRAADNLVMISKTGKGSRFLDDIPKDLLDVKQVED